MFSAFKRHWFIVGLLTLIPLALFLARADPPESVIKAFDRVPTSWCTAAILFLMAITLNTGRLLDSLRRPLPVLTACGVNQIVVPILCLPLLLIQRSTDMKVGLLIAASVPCTMAAASVWTRRAEGNDAVSLLVTLVTNGLCFLVTPIWLAVGSRWFETGNTSSDVAFSDMVLKLTLAALCPAMLGQLFRLSAGVKNFVDRNKPWFSNTAQLIILSLVFISTFRGGLRFGQQGGGENLRHTEFAIVWFSCVVLHVAAMIVAWWISGKAGFKEEDRRACVIAGSQKTLPIGILVSQSTGLPFSLVPMLMYHASQLFIDTWVADRLKKRPQDNADKVSV
ncbi:MAG: bile acid:sodium symporter [Fuerstiella sp.]